jgi:hypothetical protein
VLVWLRAPAGILLTTGTSYGVLAFGLATAVGWAIPADRDNPLGQIIGSLATLFLFGVSAAAAGHWLPVGSAGWAAAVVAVGLGGLLCAPILERGRWRRQLLRRPRPFPHPSPGG